METKKVYLDYSASTPLHSEVLEEMIKIAPLFGNPSSIHQIGQKSNHLLNQCRDNISHLLGCQSSEIIFTGGATESNNFILQGIALQAKKENIPHFIISPLEHSSVRETAFFLEKYKKIELSLLPIDKTGIVKLEDNCSSKANEYFFPYGCCAICWHYGVEFKRKFSRRSYSFFS